MSVAEITVIELRLELYQNSFSSFCFSVGKFSKIFLYFLEKIFLKVFIRIYIKGTHIYFSKNYFPVNH